MNDRKKYKFRKDGTRAPDLDAFQYRHMAELLLNKYGTLQSASFHLGYAGSTIHYTLTGKNNPRKELIDTLLQSLGVTYEELFREDYES